MRRLLEMRADFSIYVHMDRGEIIIYQTADGETRLDVRMENDSVWLTQAQIAQLFGTEIPAISKHIRNIFQSGELEREATISKMEMVRQEGKRTVKRRIDTYNLDMILSVGYRVNSKNATQFRIWANKVLKEYLIKGYAVNSQAKIEQLEELKQTVRLLSKVLSAKEVTKSEAVGLLRVITDYTYGLDTLDRYDYQQLEVSATTTEEPFHATYENAMEALQVLRDKFGGSGEDIGKKQSEIATLKDQVIAHKKQKETLSKKINVSEQNRAVDNEATRLIHTIQKFLIRFKEEKKKALAKKLEAKLQSYLHKTNLVKKVIVDINGNGDDVDICLFGYDDKKIDNSILSMGERQMFASALLSALVDETEIEFPVFIDSPMQKFDPQHTKNVLTKFYPNVSKQVILFPLLKKELTEEEYQYIQPIVSKSYLINNEKNGSHFVEVIPENLFEEYNNSEHAN